MTRRAPYWILPLLCAALAFCGCAKNKKCGITGPSIVPGRGVNTGNGAVCIGFKAKDTRKELGPASVEEDLGPVGVRFSYPDRSFSGLYAGPGKNDPVVAIYLSVDVNVSTEGGVTVGSTEADVTAEFGTPETDPFMNVWWYRQAGIAFQFKEGRVFRIQVFQPAAN